MKTSLDLNPSRITIVQRIKSKFLHSAEALHNLFPEIDVSPPSGTQARGSPCPSALSPLAGKPYFSLPFGPAHGSLPGSLDASLRIYSPTQTLHGPYTLILIGLHAFLPCETTRS